MYVNCKAQNGTVSPNRIHLRPSQSTSQHKVQQGLYDINYCTILSQSYMFLSVLILEHYSLKTTIPNKKICISPQKQHTIKWQKSSQYPKTIQGHKGISEFFFVFLFFKTFDPFKCFCISPCQVNLNRPHLYPLFNRKAYQRLANQINFELHHTLRKGQTQTSQYFHSTNPVIQLVLFYQF